MGGGAQQSSTSANVSAANDSYLITNVMVPVDDKGPNGYSKLDIYIANGKIEKIQTAFGLKRESFRGAKIIDGTDKMLMPGFVNAHTHSGQSWGRGLVKMMVYLSTMQCGVEALMTGATAVFDHIFVRDLEDLGAAVQAYKELGIRAYIAPMLGDCGAHWDWNYFPIAPNAKARNEAAKKDGVCLGGLAPDGGLREELEPQDPAMTEKTLTLYREAIEKFHDPENGINIALGPITPWSASNDLYIEATKLRKKYGLAGHTHVLETRAQKVHSREKYPGQGCVKFLKEIGWMDLPGTACAHCVWIDSEEQDVFASTGAVAVHNPVSNTRLGSGVAPLNSFRAKGMNVAIGCDGACSNDSQHMLEAVKMACILNPLTSPDYRDWISPREVIKMATKGGAAAIGCTGRIGEIKEGYEADLVLYDLNSLTLLPRTDPIGLLVLGSHNMGPGGAVHSAWARGKLILEGGVPKGVDIESLKKEVIASQPNYTDPAITDCTGTPFEVEYRAAMGLDGGLDDVTDKDELIKDFPKNRVLYNADMPYK